MESVYSFSGLQGWFIMENTGFLVDVSEVHSFGVPYQLIASILFVLITFFLSQWLNLGKKLGVTISLLSVIPFAILSYNLDLSTDTQDEQQVFSLVESSMYLPALDCDSPLSPHLCDILLSNPDEISELAFYNVDIHKWGVQGENLGCVKLERFSNGYTKNTYLHVVDGSHCEFLYNLLTPTAVYDLDSACPNGDCFMPENGSLSLVQFGSNQHNNGVYWSTIVCGKRDANRTICNIFLSDPYGEFDEYHYSHAETMGWDIRDPQLVTCIRIVGHDALKQLTSIPVSECEDRSVNHNTISEPSFDNTNHTFCSNPIDSNCLSVLSIGDNGFSPSDGFYISNIKCGSREENKNVCNIFVENPYDNTDSFAYINVDTKNWNIGVDKSRVNCIQLRASTVQEGASILVAHDDTVCEQELSITLHEVEGLVLDSDEDVDLCTLTDNCVYTLFVERIEQYTDGVYASKIICGRRDANKNICNIFVYDSYGVQMEHEYVHVDITSWGIANPQEIFCIDLDVYPYQDERFLNINKRGTHITVVDESICLAGE